MASVPRKCCVMNPEYLVKVLEHYSSNHCSIYLTKKTQTIMFYLVNDFFQEETLIMASICTYIETVSEMTVSEVDKFLGEHATGPP